MAKANARPVTRTETAKVRIYLVDDHPVIRRGMAQLLSEHGNYHIAGESEGVMQAIADIMDMPVDLVIVDLSLADGSGLELIKSIHAMQPKIRILVASMHHDAMYAQRAIRAGANGYLSKEQPPDQILQAVELVLAGQIYICPELASAVLQNALKPDDQTIGNPIATLSDRELEVFELLGDGMPARDIADHLSLSIKTIDTYRDHIKTKLNLDSANEVTHHAIRWKLQQEQC